MDLSRVLDDGKLLQCLIDAEWEESKHPRRGDGKFGEGGGEKKSLYREIPITLEKLGYGDNPVKMYHGTNSSFENFDIGKIGSSHATTEGWGIYLSSDKANCKRFGKNTKIVELTQGDMPTLLDESVEYDNQSEYVKEKLKPVIESMRNPSDTDITLATTGWCKDKINKNLSYYEEVKKIQWNPGKLRDYFNELPADKKNIKEGILGSENPTGREIYSYIVRSHGGSNRFASKLLESYGIFGMVMPSYADRLAKNINAVNYVIWDEKLLNKKNTKYEKTPKKKESDNPFSEFIEKFGKSEDADPEAQAEQVRATMSATAQTLDKRTVGTVEFIGETVKVFTVNGEFVRTPKEAGGLGMIQFTMGGNAYAPGYGELCAEDEVCLHNLMSPDDTMATLIHELTERYVMKTYKIGYDPAHEVANRIETAARQAMKAPGWNWIADAEFKEEQHPRAESGQFGAGGGGPQKEEDFPVTCSWCNKETHKGNAALPISHGMCPECAIDTMAEFVKFAE